MKTVKIGIGLLTVAMAVMGQQLDGVSYQSNNGVFKRAIVSCQAKMAFLQAGYEYTQEEKDNAREEIALLEDQQAAMLQQYNEIKARQDLSTQERDEHVHSVVSSMYRLNDDIKELQLITGDAWSNDRKKAWGFVALVAAGLVGYKFFGPSIIAIVTKNPKDSNKLSAKQKEQKQQLEQQQQKQLLDEKIAKRIRKEEAAEKEANRVAQEKADKKRVKEAKQLEDKKENLRKIEEEAQKRAEYIVKAKEQKERNEKHYIINQNIIDAQEKITHIKNAISNEKAQLNGEAGNQETNNKLTQLNEELTQAKNSLQNRKLEAELNNYREKERNKEKVAAQYKEFLQKQKKEQREIQIKILKSTANFLAETALYTINMTAQLSVKAIQIGYACFNNLKARACLSDKDQAEILHVLSLTIP